MRRIESADSLGALISSTDEQSSRNSNFCNFQSLMEGLEDEGSLEGKKRRLSIDQVKALERTFDVENKLEPERKVKLAQELGLQPRQVAVWFQNRRARWKTKQLERDYGVLKANYEALKANYQTLVLDNDVLHKEVKELKGRLREENSDGYLSVKEEMDPLMTENNNQSTGETLQNDYNGGAGAVATLFSENLKDGSSESDSSAVLNEGNSPKAATSSPAILRGNRLLVAPFPPAPTSALYCCGQVQKMEEQSFFGGEEACNFFSDEQAPTLPWYSSDQWS